MCVQGPFGARSVIPGTRVADSYGLPGVHAWNQTWVLSLEQKVLSNAECSFQPILFLFLNHIHFFNFFIFVRFETGFFCVALPSLELTL